MGSETLRIAIAQPWMRWTGDENAATALRTIALAADAGMQLCVFPEAMLPGFHRRIVEFAKRDLVAGWVDSLQTTCARHKVAATFGAPTFDDGRIYNSQLFVDESGRLVGAVSKQGLTDPEATFFARGTTRPVIEMLGQRCTAVICREIEDHDTVCTQLTPQAPQLVFWPGQMRPQPEDAGIEPPPHVRNAQRLARTLNAWIIQSNWPNALNRPEESVGCGRSVVISPAGDIAIELPQSQPGVGMFTLGEPSFRWHAQAV